MLFSCSVKTGLSPAKIAPLPSACCRDREGVLPADPRQIATIRTCEPCSHTPSTPLPYMLLFPYRSRAQNPLTVHAPPRLPEVKRPSREPGSSGTALGIRRLFPLRLCLFFRRTERGGLALTRCRRLGLPEAVFLSDLGLRSSKLSFRRRLCALPGVLTLVAPPDRYARSRDPSVSAPS